jgi:hypothetical protein
VFATGELHDLRLRVPRVPSGIGQSYAEKARFGAVNVVQRATPVATKVSVVTGYDREVAARSIERRLREMPCRSIGSEVALPIHLHIAATGGISSTEMEPSTDRRLNACVRHDSREWDFPYPFLDRRTGVAEPAEMAFIIVFPAAVEQSGGGGATSKARP